MRFDPDKLETNIIPPTTSTEPIEGRKYTLTHSDDTGMMFLDISNKYNYSAINEKLRDEVLGKWKIYDFNCYILIFYVYVGGDDYSTASKRYSTFKYHLNSAIQAILFGDSALLSEHTYLLNMPIYVKFDSDIPVFDNYEFYGLVSDYVLSV